MRFSEPIPVIEIAKMINAKLKGNNQLVATGINEIHKVTSGDITFVDFEKYYDQSLHSAASIIIIDKDSDVPEGKALLICEKPFLAYEQIAQKYRPFSPWLKGTENIAEIHETAVIEPGVLIGNNVRIGARSYIQAGTIIRDHVQIGADVHIQSGCVIGSDAFYLKKWHDHYVKWTTAGRVVIEDKVHIGAGCTINHGVSGATIIGEGTQIDCQVQIGHGVVIGKHCLLAAQVGIAGKTIIGDWCTLYGQVGVAQNLVIGSRVTILAKSGVGDNIPDGQTYFGIPATPARSQMKEKMVLKMLADSWEKVRKLLR